MGSPIQKKGIINFLAYNSYAADFAPRHSCYFYFILLSPQIENYKGSHKLRFLQVVLHEFLALLCLHVALLILSPHFLLLKVYVLL